MHLQLRDQQLQTISYVYIDSYQNFRITANQKSTIDKQGISGEEIYLIVNKHIIYHVGGHLTSFLEC